LWYSLLDIARTKPALSPRYACDLTQMWLTPDTMAGWHHWLDGREFEWTPAGGDGQGGLACCDSWGRKELDMTEWLIWTEAMIFSRLGALKCIFDLRYFQRTMGLLGHNPITSFPLFFRILHGSFIDCICF